MKAKKIFSHQLIVAMHRAGFHSSRSPSGICIKKLAEITNTSPQICRRYIRGETLPDYDKILKIAETLNVSPGELLFGELNNRCFRRHDYITIHKEIMMYFFLKMGEYVPYLFKESDSTPDFLMSLLTEIAAIETNEAGLKRILDLAFSSLETFKQNHY